MEPSQHSPRDCAHVHALAALLADDDIDAALEAGLMDVQIDQSCDHCKAAAQRIAIEQARLRFNWAARERYRARAARLERRAAQRQARRPPAPIAAETKAVTAPNLPPAVAAALARAKARATERSGA